jgi:hypothetical protein
MLAETSTDPGDFSEIFLIAAARTPLIFRLYYPDKAQFWR